MKAEPVMSQQSHTPGYVDIKPRNREHEIAESLGRDWFAGHPFKTAWFNAMSITFPLGEKFFIDSVRYYADQIEDPKLQAEIRNFCGQEGFHRWEQQHDVCASHRAAARPPARKAQLFLTNRHPFGLSAESERLKERENERQKARKRKSAREGERVRACARERVREKKTVREREKGREKDRKSAH